MALTDHYLRIGVENVPYARYAGTRADNGHPENLIVLLTNPRELRLVKGNAAVQAFSDELRFVSEAYEAERQLHEGWVGFGEEF